MSRSDDRKRRGWLIVSLYLVMLMGFIVLGGCASAPTTPATVLVPTPIPCAAARELPEQPAESLTLDASRPGEAVQAYAANRAEWIGYGKALRTRIEACK